MLESIWRKKSEPEAATSVPALDEFVPDREFKVGANGDYIIVETERFRVLIHKSKLSFRTEDKSKNRLDPPASSEPTTLEMNIQDFSSDGDTHTLACEEAGRVTNFLIDDSERSVALEITNPDGETVSFVINDIEKYVNLEITNQEGKVMKLFINDKDGSVNFEENFKPSIEQTN